MIEMGKYGAYVWPAYGISALVLLGLIADTLIRSARWRRRAERVAADRSRPCPPGGNGRFAPDSSNRRPKDRDARSPHRRTPSNWARADTSARRRRRE